MVIIGPGGCSIYVCFKTSILMNGDFMAIDPEEFWIPFGKYGPGADHRTVGEVKSSYLRWMLEKFDDDDWSRYPGLYEAVEEEMERRDRSDVHF